jgi:hypothetical protein
MSTSTSVVAILGPTPRHADDFAPEGVVERMLALYRDMAGRRLARG